MATKLLLPEGSTTATVCVRARARREAAGSARYSSRRTAACTWATVSGRTPARPCSTRSTVARLTPAAAATSTSWGRRTGLKESMVDEDSND